MLSHPWRVRNPADATVWLLPGWEMCNSTDWSSKGVCYQTVMNTTQLKPAPTQVVAVASTSRPNDFGQRYKDLWDNPFWKLANENYCVWEKERCENDYWMAVPKASSYLVRLPLTHGAHPHPPTQCTPGVYLREFVNDRE
jgi:hypothetical protein